MGGKKIPSGALFYMPLSGTNYLQELGENRTMSYSGTLTPTTFQNVPCLQFNQYANIFNTSEIGSLPTGNHSLSLSIWVYQNTINVDQTFIFYGKQSTKANLWVFDAGPQIKMGSWAGDLNTNTKGESKWHHYVATYDKDQGKYFAYRDGVLLNSSNVSGVNLTWNGLGIGRRDNANDSRFRGGYMAAARIYDRSLTQEEITELSQEYQPKYEITASDQTFRFNPTNDPNTKNISYSTTGTVNLFEIISGELPNTITFNTSTGKFSGKALTDANHTYNLVVRMSGQDVITKEINVTINTFSVTNLSITSPQTFNYITESHESRYIDYTCENYDYATYEITSGSLPTGFSISQYDGSMAGESAGPKSWFSIVSNGQQTSAINQSFVIAIKTLYHQTPVSATINVNIQLNRITVPNQTLKFYIDDGPLALPIEYTSEKQITPVYSISGTLPNGFTFNSTSGTIEYDGVYSTPTSGSIDVNVNSSTGSSIQGSGTYTIQLLSGSIPIPRDVWLYCPCSDSTTFECKNSNVVMGTNGNPTFYTAAQEGRDCVEFNGSPKNISFNNVYTSPSIPVENEARSVNYWIKCPSNMGFPSSMNRSINIFSYGQGNQWRAFRSALLIATQDLSAYQVSQDCYNGIPGGTFIVGTNSDIQLYPNGFDTDWHMITITYDGTNFKVYRDSTLVAHKQLTGQFKTGSVYRLVLGIGDPGLSSWNYFYTNPGYRLSSFRMWKRALTDQEVAKLYLQ